MKVLVACEFSGVVRDAFERRGHDAWSCDLLPTESVATRDAGKHLQTDVRDVLAAAPSGHWDLLIAHPPCTHLASSGALHFARKRRQQLEALQFVWTLLNADVERIAIENPIGVISSQIRPPDQVVHPYFFGHPTRKATCWWLKNLPCLRATNVVKVTEEDVMRLGPSPWRAHERSKTYLGMAEAMAEQWGT